MHLDHPDIDRLYKKRKIPHVGPADPAGAGSWQRLTPRCGDEGDYHKSFKPIDYKSESNPIYPYLCP